MQKKSHSKKAKKKHPINSFWFKLSAAFFVGILFYIGTTLLTHAQQPTCANSKTCNTDLSLQINNNALGVFNGKVVTPPKIYPENETSPVLGATTLPGEKHIYVDLSSQTLFAYQGSTLFFTTLVSTGKWGITPTGNFHIWEKLLSTRMTGGEGDDAYDLPNVPYVMYFYNDFGLHGAYWHDNFGHRMSHGCVNLRQTDAKTLFDWADGPNGDTPGTAVSICDQITQDRQCIQNNPVQ